MNWGGAAIATCEDVIALAARFIDEDRQLVVAGNGERIVLGRVFAFRPGALPLRVWMHRTIESALQDNGLWCEGATLGVDLEYGADWDEEDDSSSWPAEAPFVLWATDSALFSGEATAVARPVEPAPRDYMDDDAYMEVQELTIRLLESGGRASLPPSTEHFIDEEPVHDSGGGWCIAAFIGLGLVVVLAVVGVIAIVSWLI